MKKESWCDLFLILSFLALVAAFFVAAGVEIWLGLSQWLYLGILLSLYAIYFKMKE